MRRLLSHWKAKLEFYLIREWQHRGLFAWLLWPLSWIFGALVRLRRISFILGWARVTHLPVPVVVVGNLTIGGTGKTPTVIALVEALRAAGFTPGVIARGYGASIAEPRPVTTVSTAQEVGDEPLLIARRTNAPIWVCPDRVAAARALCAAQPEVDVIISDDGLQHYRLARDFELAVFDHRLAGNRFLLPAGPLREPLQRARDATLINGINERELPNWPNTFSMKLKPAPAWHLENPALQRPLERFMNERIFAAAGIGAPERFFETLRQHGLQPSTHALPDHFSYVTNPFNEVKADAILITEKDAVKCQTMWHDARLWAVPIEATLDARLIALIVEKIRGRSST